MTVFSERFETGANIATENLDEGDKSDTIGIDQSPVDEYLALIQQNTNDPTLTQEAPDQTLTTDDYTQFATTPETLLTCRSLHPLICLTLRWMLILL